MAEMPNQNESITPDERARRMSIELDALSKIVGQSDKQTEINGRIDSLKDLASKREELKNASKGMLEDLKSKIAMLRPKLDQLGNPEFLGVVGSLESDVHAQIAKLLPGLDVSKPGDETDAFEDPRGFFGKAWDTVSGIVSGVQEGGMKGIKAGISGLGGIFKGLQNSIAATFGPMMESLSDLPFMKNLIGGIAAIAGVSRLALVKAIGDGVEVSSKMVSELMKIATELTPLSKQKNISNQQLMTYIGSSFAVAMGTSGAVLASALMKTKDEATRLINNAPAATVAAPGAVPPSGAANAPAVAPSGTPTGGSEAAQNTVPQVTNVSGGVDVMYKGKKLEVRILADQGKLQIGDKIWGLKMISTDSPVEIGYQGTFLKFQSITMNGEDLQIKVADNVSKIPKSKLPALCEAIYSNGSYPIRQQVPGHVYGTITRELSFQTV